MSEREGSKAVLTYEHGGLKISFETNAGIDIHDFHQLCKILALAVGYHPDNVKEVFVDE